MSRKKIERTMFTIDWPCFGKHSRRDLDCQCCDIEGPCIDQKDFLNHQKEQGAL